MAAARDEPRRAAVLLGASATRRVALGVPGDRMLSATWERAAAAAREALGVDAFDAAWEEGRSMTIERAMELALSNEENRLDES